VEDSCRLLHKAGHGGEWTQACRQQPLPKCQWIGRLASAELKSARCDDVHVSCWLDNGQPLHVPSWVYDVLVVCVHCLHRAQVELQYLQGLFSHALQSAATASRPAAAGDVAAGNVAAAAMRLMSSILGWEFKGAQSSALSSSSAAAAAAAAEVRAVSASPCDDPAGTACCWQSARGIVSHQSRLHACSFAVSSA
jgi:hypothetical protein